MTDITLRCTAPNVGVNAVSPTHDMKLLDELGNSVGLIFCDRYGRRNPIGVTTGNMPRSPMRISSGNTGYSDQEPPFITEVQSTWVGGRAQADLSNDRTRFADSFRLDTTKQFPICAPAVIAQQGTGSANGAEYLTGTVGYSYPTAKPVACLYPPSKTARVVNGFTLQLGYDAGPVTFYYKAIVSATIPTYTDYDAATDYTDSVYVPRPDGSMTYLPITPLTVPANANLWLLVFGTDGGSFNTVRDVHDVAGAAVYEKASGSADWGTEQGKHCFYGYIHYQEEYDSLFFEYRKQMYVVMSTLEKNKSELYMNGYRGFCASNSADKTKTNIDASGLQTSELAGCIIYLIAGAGSQERRPWRKVVSNTPLGECVMDKPWKIAHTVDTEYVVLGLNKWVHIPALDGSDPQVNLFTSAVKTVTVVGDYVVFGFGTSRPLVYFKVSKTAAGAAYYIKNDFATDAQYADVLQTIVDKYGVTKVWRGVGAKVDSALAVDWASPYTTAPTLVFDINYEQREDLYLRRDRLYVDLYKDMVARNKSLADLDRQKNDLITEITQTIGAAPAKIASPGTYTYYDGTQNVTVDSYLKVANANYLYAQDDIKSLKYEFDDLTTEHNRLLVEHARLTTDVNKPLTDADTLIRNYDNLTVEHNRLCTDYDRLTGTNQPVSDGLELRREYDALTREHNFLLSDYARLTGNNAPLSDALTLMRKYNDLTTEHNRILTDYNRLIGDDAPLTNYETLVREYDDLTLEHIRLLEDFDDSEDAAVIELATEALLDNFISRKRLAGSATAVVDWVVANRASVTFGNAGSLSNTEYFGTHTALTGSDIAIAKAQFVTYNEAVTKLSQRDSDIFSEKVRLAGLTPNSTGWSMTTLTYTFGGTTGSGCPHNQGLGSYAPIAGSDIAIAQSYNEATTEIFRRDYEIYHRKKILAGASGAYSITSPTDVTYCSTGIAHDAGIGATLASDGSAIAIADAYDEATTKLKQRDEDIYTEKVRLAGVGTGTWSMTTRTYTFGNGIDDAAMFGSGVADAGSDIAIAQSYNEAVTKLEQRDEDIYTEKTRIAGSTGTYSFSNQTAVTYTANAIAHSTKIGSSTGKSGSDLYESTEEYANANTDIRQLIDRASAIIGTGTIASPGTDSELKRITDDITYETARLTYESGDHNSIYRQILDLTYQISNASNTDAENTATDALSNLAAHVDRANWINAKYLPTFVYAGDKVNPVTNIIGYGEPKIPYILKSNGFGSISDGVYQELPIGEMTTINSILNGTAAMQFGVYLYFNLEGGMIERYYDQRLDDVGANRDEGLPTDRQGEVTKLLPYPGRYYAAIDAGSAGYSSVLCNNLLGEYSWHEIWRSTTLGDQIYDVYVQTIPGFQEVDRLWIATTGSIIAVPIAISPPNMNKYDYFGYGASSPAYTYDFTTAGWVETSWIDFDVKSIDKYFHSVTIFSDYTGDVKTGNEYKISVYFKVDGDVDWTHAGDVKASEYVNGKFEVGVKELDLRYQFGSVSGKKIKFRIKMMPCADAHETPRLKAIVINAILRLPSKRSWNVNFLIDPEVDLNDKPIHDKTGLLYYWLNKWANSKTYPIPLTMYTNDYSSDNLRVMIDPTSLVTYDVITDQSASKNKTLRHIGSLTLYEV